MLIFDKQIEMQQLKTRKLTEISAFRLISSANSDRVVSKFDDFAAMLFVLVFLCFMVVLSFVCFTDGELIVMRLLDNFMY